MIFYWEMDEYIMQNWFELITWKKGLLEFWLFV